ncbi:MAG TPA: AAA family ATPase [Dongiaceae bacterium]|nr:AAA family ATPase [Dongiaceae bacterium]
MYEQFFGLSGKPFSLLPDADFLYMSRRHRMALNLLDYGIMTQAGFVVITGEVGAGKTTIVRRFLRAANESLTIGVVTNASAGFGNLMSLIAMAYGLEHRELDTIALYNQFIEFLVEQYGAGKRTLLVIDEAQNLSMDMLEDLRMLSNVNNEKDQLLQVVLVGQPELLAVLKQPQLRQFAQRIAVHYHLEPLGYKETIQYIRYRLSVVDGRPEIFDNLACLAAHYFTGGVPRLLNLLCDLSLVYAFAEEMRHVNIETVIDVVADRSTTGLSPFRPLPDDFERNRFKQEIASMSHTSEILAAS